MDEELLKQIEKMKCCFNCRYSTNYNDGWQMYCDELDLETWTGSHCDKWELGE